MRFVAISTLAAALCVALAGCVSEETAGRMRGDLIAKAFPDPADRQGVYFVFPLESGGRISRLEIAWSPDEVSQSEIGRRMQGFCRRNGTAGFNGLVGLERDFGIETVNTPSGPRQVRRVYFRCLTA